MKIQDEQQLDSFYKKATETNTKDQMASQD